MKSSINLVAATTLHSAGPYAAYAARILPLLRGKSPADHSPAVGDEATAPHDRQLLSNCWGGGVPSAAWHPVYSNGWSQGYCRYEVDCNSPAYSTELACCNGAYMGQVSGYCLMQLPSPPTLSPTDDGGLDVYYPDYDTPWIEAGCINTRPMPNGRPTYTTMLACCKNAYAGQVSGKIC